MLGTTVGNYASGSLRLSQCHRRRKCISGTSCSQGEFELEQLLLIHFLRCYALRFLWRGIFRKQMADGMVQYGVWRVISQHRPSGGDDRWARQTPRQARVPRQERQVAIGEG